MEKLHRGPWCSPTYLWGSNLNNRGRRQQRRGGSGGGWELPAMVYDHTSLWVETKM